MLRLTALALFFATASGCEDVKNQVEKKATNQEVPNFLVIIADDAGWDDFGFHGSEIQTPTLDSLAKEGLILNRFYTYPTCSPARAAFLTGRPASRMGIVAPISDKSELKLPDSILTLPQALKKLNYNTALLGKWHLGLQPENGPKAYGFDYSYGFLHGQLDQYEHTYKNGDSTWHRNGTFLKEKGHVTDLITRAAVNYINQHKASTPFYMQVAYSAPHIPLQETEFWLQNYKSIEDPSRRAYAAAMSHMDAGIGRILKTLGDNELNKNTVILFFSDNGAQEQWIPTTQYSGKFEPNLRLGSNEPLRDFKTTNYEGATRVPALLVWPQNIPGGTSDNFVSITDWMPTFLNWAKAENIPASVEGELIDYLLKPKKVERLTPIYTRGHLQESVIVPPFKLIRTRHLKSDPDYELFNIENDPAETNDLSQSDKHRFDQLLSLLKREFSRDYSRVNKELSE